MKKTIAAIMVLATLCGCGEVGKNNPLINPGETPHGTPEFSKITLDHYREAFDIALQEAKAEFEEMVNNTEEPTFENTILALENNGKLLNKVSTIFFALDNVESTDETQQLILEVEPKLVAFNNDIRLNPVVFERVKSVYDNRESLNLDKEQAKLLDDTYKSFIRGGAGLDEEQKEKYRQLSSELSTLTTTFGINVLAQTNAYKLNITDAAVVEELPDFVKEAMALEAKNNNQEGWTVTLQSASYGPFMTYSSNRELKEQLWMKSNTKALNSEENDNSEIMKRIGTVRMEIANLFGYETYADYVLEERMAESRQTVQDFLAELLDATKSYAQKDYQMVSDYAKSCGADYTLMPWDWSYWSEKYKNAKYSISDEEIKPYLELNQVKEGIFTLVDRLYGIKFKENKDIDVYNPEVQAYEVYEENGDFLGVIYMDFFPRATKRSGAWMTSYRDMYVDENGNEVRPFVTLCANFTKPTENTPALLTFDELETFLHEFGHCLHGLFAEGKYASLTGTAVYRDFVELPSQIMENWATEPEFLNIFAKHYQTGEPMPQELIDKICAAGNYLAAYLNVRQLSFGMVDMAWHTITEPVTMPVEEFERQSMAATQILPYVAGTAMTPAFTHIFSGGYAAGYYSYKWAEVLEADAFSLFKEKGIFSKEAASSFRENILSKGGIEHPMDLYVKFRGHKPDTKALIDKMDLK
ncbi:MAG: M3 family metallopeptidase [Tidjanibacter sp.]|nr:M3 family metallopeptidase [Tidjanibacter sp.]